MSSTNKNKNYPQTLFKTVHNHSCTKKFEDNIYFVILVLIEILHKFNKFALEIRIEVFERYAFYIGFL